MLCVNNFIKKIYGQEDMLAMNEICLLKGIYSDATWMEKR